MFDLLENGRNFFYPLFLVFLLDKCCSTWVVVDSATPQRWPHSCGASQSEISPKHPAMESPSTARNFSPHPSRSDPGHRVNVCASREFHGMLCSSSRRARVHPHYDYMRNTCSHRPPWFRVFIGQACQTVASCTSPRDTRNRLRCGPRPAPPGLDCSAPATDQAKDAASPHIGAIASVHDVATKKGRNLLSVPKRGHQKAFHSVRRFEKHGRFTYELSKLSRRPQQR